MRTEEYYYNKGYKISKSGEIINPRNKVIKGSISASGYLVIGGRINGKRTGCSVHRLQAYQKYKKALYEENIEVRHLNGDPLDNSFDNIKIGSHSENMMDITRENRVKNALHATSFIRKYDKSMVKKFHNKSKSYKKTMSRFGISSKSTLHYILNNQP